LVEIAALDRDLRVRAGHQLALAGRQRLPQSAARERHVIRRPVKTGEVGFEYLFGEHVRKDGASATASRLQFSLKYDLIC